MFKSFVIFAALFIASTSAGFIQTHHVIEPVVAKVGAVVHSVPSAVSHQSFTRVHNKAVVQDVVAPVLKTVVSPVVHAVPVVHAAPLVHTVPIAHAVPVVHSVPVVYGASHLKTYAFHH